MSKDCRWYVVGASGFIGRHLADALARDFEVFPFDLPHVDINKQTSYTSIEKLLDHDKQRKNIIVNCGGLMDATLSRKNPDIFFKTNGHSVIQLAKWASKVGFDQFIQLSSETVFGGGDKVFEENSPRLPLHPYGISKLIAEVLLQNENLGKLSVTILRLPVVVGPNQGLDNPISIFCKEAMKPVPVSVFNGGLHRRKFLHVEDLVRCVISCGTLTGDEKTNVKIFNMPGFVTDMNGIIKEITSCGIDVSVDYKSSNTQAFSLVSDHTTFEKQFGAICSYDIRSMVTEFIEEGVKK